MRQPIPLLLLSLFISNLLAASALSWDRTEVDLEMEPEQEEVRASFNVTNEGDKKIRIARVKTSCGCTGSIIDRKILEPGNSTEIIATFNKGKRQDLNRNKLEVFIDSQAEPIATLRMNVRIPELVEAIPKIVYWNPSSSKSERRVAITLDKRYVDKILRVEYDRSKLDVTEEEDPAGKATRLLRIAPKSYDSQFRGTVKVIAIGKDGRKAEARIHAFVQP
jgi:hypothetical protein